MPTGGGGVVVSPEEILDVGLVHLDRRHARAVLQRGRQALRLANMRHHLLETSHRAIGRGQRQTHIDRLLVGLAALRQPRQAGERRFEMGDGFGRGGAALGLLAGPPAECGRLVPQFRVQRETGENFDILVQTVEPARLDCLDRAAESVSIGFGRSSLRRGGVRVRVRKDDLDIGSGPHNADQPGRRQRTQRLVQLLLSETGGRRQDRLRSLEAERRGALKHPSRAVGQAADARGEPCLGGGRDLGLAIEQCPRGDFQKLRQAFGGIPELAPHRRRTRIVADQPDQHMIRFVRRQPVEVARQAGVPIRPAQRSGFFASDDHQHLASWQTVRHSVEDRQCLGIQPLGVFDDEHRRRRRGAQDNRAHRRDDLLAPLHRLETAPAGIVYRKVEDGMDGGQQRHQVSPEILNVVANLGGDIRLEVALLDAGPRAQQPSHRATRDVQAIGRPPYREDSPVAIHLGTKKVLHDP